MKILMLCGVFAKENTAEVIAHARRHVEFSANTFQEKLIGGFRKIAPEMAVISAPFIGSYPNASDILKFTGFCQPQEQYTYVPFNNVWGLRNFSRTVSLKRALADFIEAEDEQKLIVVYCAHTPFLAAADYAKRKDGRIKICLYVPDLPNYMNLSADRSRIYDVAKAMDIADMKSHMRRVDTFVLLTWQMREQLPVGDKPCLIREGIMDEIPPRAGAEDQGSRYIVYTGKLDAKFGIPELLEAFDTLKQPELRLVLCGRGDCEDAVARAAERDSRIIAAGQVTPEQAGAWQRRAAVLVNPRQNNEEYTQYSFPSKNVEYLLTGKPVAAFMLSGMPEHYRDFIYEADGKLPPAQALAQAICRGMEAGEEEQSRRYQAYVEYAAQTLGAEKIAKAIVEMCFD